MAKTEDQLRKVFASRVDRVRSALEQSRQERAAISETARRLEEADAEIPRIRSRLDKLPAEHSAAVLKGDEGEQQRLKEEHESLTQRLQELQQQRDKAAGELSGGDPYQAEKLSLGRAQSLASEEIGAARKERERLVKVLDEALAELEEESREATALGQQFTRTEKEAS